jgi:hypothetical protein
VAFLEVSEAEASRLKSMPDIVTHFKFGVLDGTYILPPILYPDGKFYLKVYFLPFRSLKKIISIVIKICANVCITLHTTF